MTSCSQSSTGWGGVCRRAIDGNTNQDYGKHSCTHTRKSKGWWRGNLSRPARITKVVIYNRLTAQNKISAISYRLNNFVVTIDGKTCGSYNSRHAFKVKTFHCNQVGRTVEVRSLKNTYLTLCEVEVFGDRAKETLGGGKFYNAKKRPVLAGFLGCFRDKLRKRDLSWRVPSSRFNTVQRCRARCAQRGYRFAGTQNSQDCWCGNHYGKYGRSGNCNMKCTGNRGQTCGGRWSNSVYSTGTKFPNDKRRPVLAGFLGCFKDKLWPDFDKFAFRSIRHNTVQKCRARCAQLGYRFAGMQYASMCYCGNRYGVYGRANNCDMRCTGNHGQTCGGFKANSVYTTGRT